MFHESLSLYWTPEAITVEPVYAHPNVQRHSLVFPRTRSDQTVIRIDSPPAPTLQQEQRETFYGIIGLARLNAGDFLVTVTNRKKVAKLLSSDIYRLEGHKISPIAKRSELVLSPAQLKDDEVYLSMLDSLLSNGFWYFSYESDITRNVSKSEEVFASSRIWEQADDRFFWNRHLQRPLIDLAKLHPDTNVGAFVLPLMSGFVEFRDVIYNSKKLRLGVISRRSKFRAGTRYNTRGVDVDGNVANNVETEQLLVYEVDGIEKIATYVQTRGSIPLFWEQRINVKYQPKMVIQEGNVAFASFKKHFNSQLSYYGPQIAINLINKKGYEARLSETWGNLNAQLNDPNVRYLHFDFHHECRNMKWGNISKLVAEIEGDLIAQGYTVAERSSESNGSVVTRPLRKQTSVVRTNCMDCLDRTNVVQSVLARRILPIQLQELCGGSGILEPDFEQTFKHLWADHADAISLVYSGTGALKTDFTRTGKRSPVGVFSDLNNSIVRYIKNNFFDGYRQDSFDLFLGNYEVNPRDPSPFQMEQRPARYVVLPAVLVFALLMFVLTLAMFEYSTNYYFVALVFWIAVIIAVQRAIIAYGTDFVDKPRLVRVNSFVPETSYSEKTPPISKKDDGKNK